ncbi:MucR family transcriptional regulator [Beijerinckia sp. L45]|uniref:MucR family transcriptional regulator n=1 Tax=Beijerinckia sp. L45 TaxID=1641855 RepID=UPI00131D84CE|nr:MucR family transcriptional regulator [Beijerinckia sp. L45]
MSEMAMQGEYLEMAANIVSAFVSNNSVPASELASLIQSVHASIQNIAGIGTPAPVVEPQEPAVSIRKSITPEFIICLEDGKKFKSLKRHLRTAYDLSPDQYRAKWGLPRDYPMVAPAYAAARSALAKQSGLGQPRSAAPEKAKAKAMDGKASAVKRGRGRPRSIAA